MDALQCWRLRNEIGASTLAALLQREWVNLSSAFEKKLTNFQVPPIPAAHWQFVSK
jgi:hypothetical protein